MPQTRGGAQEVRKKRCAGTVPLVAFIPTASGADLGKPGNTPASEGGQTGLQGSFLCPQDEKGSSKSAARCPREDSQQQQGQTCSWARSGPQEQVPPLSGGPGDQLRRASTLRLQCCRHRANEGFFMIFCLMSLSALAGAWCGISLLMWRLHGKNAPQGQPAADLSSLWNAPDVWKGQAGEMQKLRDELTHLAAEIRSIKKEVQQMREAISEPVEVPDWALKSTGCTINLQRSSSTSACLRRVFWSLFRQAFEDTFVQPDASPGYCWKMQQSQSEVLIRLPTEVQPTAITLQYCSKTATPLVTVSSAPKDFTVSGLDEEGQGETLLGSFLYSVQKEPTQTFPLQNGIPRAFRLLKLSIQNNWGKPTYTCIYRVQVHGKMVETNVVGKTDVETFPQ
ncbi:sperm-associated antigen 4 protein-like [Neopsephotus bourkii]|uniref:sperm-associated antigen 4 protein-like n=1 Tax=Neopsephotus bourkii TaxID=309878 RepID=UPI002AA5783E|nr:sperm-associated antigen 4 protein-like [Neopsephotus bourkii]